MIRMLISTSALAKITFGFGDPELQKVQELYQFVLHDLLAFESQVLSLAMASILLLLIVCQSYLCMASPSGWRCLYQPSQQDLEKYKHG